MKRYGCGTPSSRVPDKIMVTFRRDHGMRLIEETAIADFGSAT